MLRPAARSMGLAVCERAQPGPAAGWAAVESDRRQRRRRIQQPQNAEERKNGRKKRPEESCGPPGGVRGPGLQFTGHQLLLPPANCDRATQSCHAIMPRNHATKSCHAITHRQAERAGPSVVGGTSRVGWHPASDGAPRLLPAQSPALVPGGVIVSNSMNTVPPGSKPASCSC